MSIATAALPDMSRHAATKSVDDFRQTISFGLRMMLMLNIPACVGLIVLATPIVGLILESGAFTQTDTIATAGALVYYAPGLLGYSAVKIATPAFYALRDARTPVLVSVLAIVSNLVLNVSLMQCSATWGSRSAPRSRRWSSGVLLALLSRRLGGLDERRLATAFAKITLASTVMGLAAWGVEYALDDRSRDALGAARNPRRFGDRRGNRRSRRSRANPENTNSRKHSAESSSVCRVPALRPVVRLDLQTRAPSDRPPARRDALHGRRLRKHLRAVAAAAHPAPLDGSADRRHVSHALPDCGVGLPACIRPRRRSLAAPHTTQ